MRANGKVPPCDWWDFKYNLAHYIEQGLEGLLYSGVCDWDAPEMKKQKKDLEFILKWAKVFPYMESAIIATDDEDYAKMMSEYDSSSDLMIISMDAWKEWQKEQEKAFKLLAKNYSALWD